ncbi:hypothetical protein E2C01_089631 [Portunus trituberculatus]|uniref:Uncharacterized protein n=1 Tax=Portunus trituberculatus TaxID=210409 RepID=A0A5B7JCJ9_PORTR|nr:hypothetical protein [Portunus trituberculatus]
MLKSHGGDELAPGFATPTPTIRTLCKFYLPTTPLAPHRPAPGRQGGEEPSDGGTGKQEGRWARSQEGDDLAVKRLRKRSER